MVRDRRDLLTSDLLNWQPPEPAVRFDDQQVRGATLYARICRAMAVAIEESGLSREEIAARMSEYLGAAVSKPMIDAYTSEARDNHTINVVRFVALVHATGDMRLLGLLTEQFRHAVVDNRYVNLIRATQMREKAQELARMADAEEHRAGRIGQ